MPQDAGRSQRNEPGGPAFPPIGQQLDEC